MDPLRASTINAGKATTEVAMVKKKDPRDLFGDADTIEEVFGYLAGGASLCWDKKPQGTFDDQMASTLVTAALERFQVLLGNTMKAGLIEAKAELERRIALEKGEFKEGLSQAEAADAEA